MPLSQSAKYGCFFESPAAAAAADPTLNSCTLPDSETAYSAAIAAGSVWGLPAAMNSKAT